VWSFYVKKVVSYFTFAMQKVRSKYYVWNAKWVESWFCVLSSLTIEKDGDDEWVYLHGLIDPTFAKKT
jgi:hypothetical protein